MSSSINLKTIWHCLLCVLFVFNVSCLEEIDLQTETAFESAIVVEATLTNELIQQKVLLSRTYKLEEEGPTQLNGATVKVVGGGSTYVFYESQSGVYLSNTVFAAQSSIEYQLEISTPNGSNYISTLKTLTQETQIEELFFERGFNENQEEGVSVFVNSFDPTGNSKFYRFEYEETYKIIAPTYSVLDLHVNFGPPISFFLTPKPTQQLICYATEVSNKIILESTNQFEEDRLTNFRARFIKRDDAIISHRYSILVKQYIQSIEAFEFYKKLDELSSSENLFSQLQPGFLIGNMTSLSNASEKVLGYFEVSSVDSKRIFFNYEELFPDEMLPPYFISCNEFAPIEVSPGGGSPLADALTQGNKYYRSNFEPMEFEGGYYLVAPACGDCTVLGALDPPEYWIE